MMNHDFTKNRLKYEKPSEFNLLFEHSKGLGYIGRFRPRIFIIRNQISVAFVLGVHRPLSFLEYIGRFLREHWQLQVNHRLLSVEHRPLSQKHRPLSTLLYENKIRVMQKDGWISNPRRFKSDFSTKRVFKGIEKDERNEIYQEPSGSSYPYIYQI